jgi:membrane protein YdbS with pleckstrin-like domain
VAPAPSFRVIVVVVLGAVGLGVIAYAVFATTSWPLLIVGFVGLGGSLVDLWRIERARDRSLG